MGKAGLHIDAVERKSLGGENVTIKLIGKNQSVDTLSQTK